MQIESNRKHGHETVPAHESAVVDDVPVPHRFREKAETLTQAGWRLEVRETDGSESWIDLYPGDLPACWTRRIYIDAGAELSVAMRRYVWIAADEARLARHRADGTMHRCSTCGLPELYGGGTLVCGCAPEVSRARWQQVCEQVDQQLSAS